MQEDDDATFVTLIDEDGNEIEMEYVDTIEYNGSVYMVLLSPETADDNGEPVEDENYGIVLLRVETEDGEDILVTIDDENEENAVYEEAMRVLFDEDEDEDDIDEDDEDEEEADEDDDDDPDGDEADIKEDEDS